MNLFLKIIKSVLNKIRLNRYDDFTIAEHFRALGARIGKDNRIEIRSLGPEPYLITIGDHCTIAQNVVFLVHDGATWLFTDEYPSIQKFGTVEIRDNCFIGYNAVIMSNVTIGPNSIVGAGSIVTRSVPPGVVVAGNPAKFICTTEDYKKKVLAIWKEQEPEGYFRGVKKGVRYSAADIQKLKYRDLGLLKEHLTGFFERKRNAPPVSKRA